MNRQPLIVSAVGFVMACLKDMHSGKSPRFPPASAHFGSVFTTPKQ